ncbi:hypothetical protein COJ96_05755 [Bacillus sp. AFS073361]|uniref:hypothetical protein n=1 Tax=Bacillus sp. AFS073361 TaxID=2033511 RepID=UPI000BF55E50|nr:hypothetical protein [Bacillus sp. AFS073361]PFP30218.1 hypothetical protein COJ96_05755 [Bacillus sp. AFS073361]
MTARIANFAIVMATVYFALPVVFHGGRLAQAAAITLLAFVAKTLLSPEAPEIYLINGKDGEDAE